MIVAAGDIACTPGSPDGSSSCADFKTAALVNQLAPAAVLTLGDNQYESGSLAEFAGRYDRSWGQFKAKIWPGVGNHEYLTGGAAGYCSYFTVGAAANPCGGGQHYYGFDIGSWRIYSLNDECSKVPGGCGQEASWLASDIRAHPTQCALGYWHEPFRSSGEHGNASQALPLWQAFYDNGGDLVLSGHNHDYERFAPLGRDGSPGMDGMREFVVGTGGKSLYVFTAAPVPGEEVRDAATFGVLELTLHPGSYDWHFRPVAGGSFTDAGSQGCRGSSPPLTAARRRPRSLTSPSAFRPQARP